MWLCVYLTVEAGQCCLFASFMPLMSFVRVPLSCVDLFVDVILRQKTKNKKNPQHDDDICSRCGTPPPSPLHPSPSTTTTTTAAVANFVLIQRKAVGLRKNKKAKFFPHSSASRAAFSCPRQKKEKKTKRVPSRPLPAAAC